MECFLADIRDVARDFLGTQLRVAGTDLKLVDVDGGVDVLLDHALRDHDGVLEVVAVPRHEGDEHVAAERKLTVLRVRSVGQHVTFLNRLPLAHNGVLVHARAAVGAHELPQLVDMDTVFRVVLDLLLPLGEFTVLGDDDPLGIHGSDLSADLGNDDRT